MAMKPALPSELPADPLPLFESWLKEAFAEIRNAHAMTLATVDPDGRPSARMVLCRGFDAHAGWIVFYTDRESAKGQALDLNPRAALVFYWDAFERQARIEGPVTLAPDADSDAYWKSRPPDARVAASASDQSRPIESRAAFLAKVEQEVKRSGGDTLRPKRWGGYRVWAERVELWVGQPARAHDRALWIRSLSPTDAGFSGGPWRATRLQP
ncbi:MAG TPA: pyridoxamine 5'-phosphate oxidase [Candidatus Binatia bacterium]|nr:pyridoxamine 5'-phosphate oxidase [Candidatus Binatia bacterium]